MLNKEKVAMTLSVFFGIVHGIWAILVWIGWGQPLLNFAFNLNMVKPYFTVGPFSLVTGILLIVVAMIAGYILGWIFAWTWNKFNKA